MTSDMTVLIVFNIKFDIKYLTFN